MITIYLAGGMTGLSVEDQTAWRKHATDILTKSGFKVLDPTKTLPVWRDDMARAITDREIVVSNKFMILNSDVILAEFIGGRPVSLGTVSEVVHNNGRKPVIAFGSSSVMDSPWVSEHLTVRFEQIDHALDYVTRNYGRG